MQQPLLFGRVGSCLWALRGAGMSAESLENYLQMDAMEEGTSKDELQILVDSVENEDYVTKHLQVAFDAYVASHVHKDLRKMDVWSHLGIHFGSHCGTKSAQEEPEWVQEDHQEPQSTENQHLQKP